MTNEEEASEYVTMAVQLAHLRQALRAIEHCWNPFRSRKRARQALQASQATEEFYRLDFRARQVFVKTQAPEATR